MNQIKAVQEAKEILHSAGLEIVKLSLLQKSTLSSLQSDTIDHDCAFLTVFRSEMLNASNITHSRDLKRALAACRYNIIPVRASYFSGVNESDEVRDEKYCFFVQNRIDDEQFIENILRLSAKYDQHVALIIPKGEEAAYLVGTAKHDESRLGFRQKSHLIDLNFDEVVARYFAGVDRILEFKEANLLTKDEVSFTYPRPNGMLSAMGENLRGLEILRGLDIVPLKIEGYTKNQSKALSRARIILNAAGFDIEKLSNSLEYSNFKTQEKPLRHDCAILSAFRKNNSRSVNIKNAKRLEMLLNAIDGYSVTQIVKEFSFFVENTIDHENFAEVVLHQACDFDQDEVLIIPMGAQDPYIMGATKKEDALLKFGMKNVMCGANFLEATTTYFSKMNGADYKSKPAEPLSENEIILVRPGQKR